MPKGCDIDFMSRNCQESLISFSQGIELCCSYMDASGTGIQDAYSQLLLQLESISGRESFPRT